MPYTFLLLQLSTPRNSPETRLTQLKQLGGCVMRLGVLSCVVSLLLISAGLAGPADASIRKMTSIPAEPLDQALRALAKDRQFQVLYRADVVRNIQTAGAVGEFTPEEALNKLLAGTGLTYKYLDTNTVTVFAQTSNPAASGSAPRDGDEPTKEGKKSSSGGFRVAQVDQGQTSSPSTVEKKDKQAAKGMPVYLEEIVVTGSRISLSAGQQSIQPVRNFTREDIANSGQTTVGEFMNTLPDVSNFTSPLLSTIAGVESVRLHGLPAGTTLTLLDGRRVEKSSLGFFDLSSIPTSMVERVEILPVGASAIYGSDALAGAVNFILRKDFSGVEVNATLDHAPAVNNPGVTVAWGTNWGRGSASLIANYEYRGSLLGTQRAPTSSTEFPAAWFALGLVTDRCAPGNVYSTDGSNLPGLSSPQAGIPAGVTGVPTLQQFQATAGTLNLCNTYRYNDITPESRRESVLLSAHYELSEFADLFTETLLSHKTLRNQIGPQIATFSAFDGTVAASNPYNPFGIPVNVSLSYPGAGTFEFQSSSLIRPTIGVRGAISANWNYEATITLSRDQLNDQSLGADFGQISAALASSNPATALNPFTSGTPGSAQLLNSLVTPPAVNPNSVSNAFDDRLINAEAVVRGRAAQLPAGPTQVAVGAYAQQEKQHTAAFGSPPTKLQRNGYAVFGEARIPLLSSNDLGHLKERLTLSLASRYDHSNDYHGKGTWQSGLLWRPIDSFSVRGSYGQSYQAPPLADIAGSQSIFVGPIFGGIDPFRGNGPINYPVTNVFGPNYGLRAQTGTATALTIEYSAELTRRPTASVTWYDVKISNFIGGQGAQVLIDNPNLFPGAVVRSPPTAQDQQQGFLGLITQVNQTFYNYGNLHVTGFDADLRYPIDTQVGQVTASLAVSNIYRWQSALVPGAPITDGVSRANLYGVGWAPRWKGTAGLAWKNGPIALYVAGRYVGKYLDYRDFGPTTLQTGNTWIFDTSARYEVGTKFSDSRDWLGHSYISLGVVNVSNRRPPYSSTYALYDFSEFDARGRFLHLNVGTRF